MNQVILQSEFKKMKMKKEFTLILLFISTVFISTACINKKKKVLDDFTVIYNNILDLNISAINRSLTKNSKNLLKDLTEIENFNLENTIEIGEKYNIKYFMLDFVHQYRKELKKSNSDTTFYLFLGINKVPLFNFDGLYEINQEESEVKPRVHIAISSIEHGKNYLNWVRLEEENENLKLNLIYTLQLHNKKAKRNTKI